MKIGEIFIQQGLINETQLNEALHAQLIYGGHLGTCLIELGYIVEEQLGRVLGDLFKVPYAAVERFQEIPRSVIQLLPARLVEKVQAVPFEKNDKTLSVAMIDPRNLPALDEIAFASGGKVEPWVAPEVRIMQAMERYYDVSRRQRYITVCRDLDRGWNNRKERLASGGGGSVPGSGSGKPAAAANRSGASRAAIAVAAAPAVVPAATHPASPEAGPRPAPPINWSAIKDDVPNDPKDTVSEQFCAANDVDTLAEAVLDETSRTLERCILFNVKGTTAVMWSSRGAGIERDRARSLSFPIVSEPIFKLFLGEGFYAGPLPEDVRYNKFYDAMQIGLPAELLVVPVHLEDRLVALFYGDCGTACRLRGDIEEYRRLFRKLAVALNVVILKRRIRSL